MTALQPLIGSHILTLREQRVMLDADLADLYGVATKVLVQTVKRNLVRFPQDFMFQLSAEEFAALRSQSVSSNLIATMNTRDEQFFKELGARIAQARKDHGLTQQELSEQLGVAQQTLAHYVVGRARMPASMLPTVARLLTLSLDELMGQPLPRAARASPSTRAGKRGPASRLEQQIQAVAQLPKTKQQFVSQMLDTVLAQVSR